MPYDENDPVYQSRVSAFTQALAGLGWTVGRNVRMDIRWAGDDTSRLRALAQELVGVQPDIVLTSGAPATAAVQRETRTIPIVLAGVADPVASGIVPRLNQPGGNITGFAYYEATLGGKWLELLSEITPGLKRVAIMFNPDTAPVYFMPSLETAARSLKVEPIPAPVHSDAEIETAITACESVSNFDPHQVRYNPLIERGFPSKSVGSRLDADRPAEIPEFCRHFNSLPEIGVGSIFDADSHQSGRYGSL
jgi:putative ABC transport system substrate-binding protein